LYTCFVAILLYPIFGTSKDVSVSASAVLSTVVGQLIANETDKSVEPVVWAAAVSLVSGCLQLLFGLSGLGIIVEFIPS
jgi:MFS superfamily sulfate permease-like transporter